MPDLSKGGDEKEMTGYMERPSFDDWALGLAKGVALRGDCRRRQVGSVLLRPDHTVCSVGFNGVAPGEDGCLAGACPRGLLSNEEIPPDSSYDTGPGMCISSHSETNCLANSRENTAGYTLYVTDAPCNGCMRTIKAHRLARVVWPNGETVL